ncbi:hypothetical protein [Vibrio splendidus]|uniref:hypothetical protein n=2 Tax=Vibrio splendidus TaxID=29497 RepID=UPI00076A4F1B|nr:hypothetical protein [Vibrio splendidus]PHX06127.1 hypothetical protein VSPL_25880 [Vibrio splendidus]
MTVFFTVLSGVLVFVMGQLVLKLLIEPIQELRKLVSKIAYDLIKLANVLANPTNPEKENFTEARMVMREHSSNLHAHFYLVPFYNISCRLFGLPTEREVLNATKELIRLSNSRGGILANQAILNSYSIQKIKVSLGIAVPKSEWLEPEKEKNFIKVQ